MSGLTIDDPVKFERAIISQNVLPGDALYLRAGTYTGDWVSTIAGTPAAPIVIQPYQDEVVTIAGTLTINGAYTHWKNINFTNTNANKSAVYMMQPGTELEDCDISGAFLGVSWFGSGTGKIINCTFHDTGSYGIYTHNHLGGVREITGCTFTNIGGYYDAHFYSESANAVRDYAVSGCTFGKPIVIHSAIAVTNMQFLNNTFGAQLKLGNGLTVEDAREFVVSGNTFDGAAGIRAWTCSELDISDNIFAVDTDNINLVRGMNEISLNIDNNDYTGGAFAIDNIPKAWQEWQAAGYDANGTYA